MPVGGQYGRPSEANESIPNNFFTKISRVYERRKENTYG